MNNNVLGDYIIGQIVPNNHASLLGHSVQAEMWDEFLTSFNGWKPKGNISGYFDQLGNTNSMLPNWEYKWSLDDLKALSDVDLTDVTDMTNVLYSDIDKVTMDKLLPNFAAKAKELGITNWWYTTPVHQV